jgi:hypothetical protein
MSGLQQNRGSIGTTPVWMGNCTDCFGMVDQSVYPHLQSICAQCFAKYQSGVYAAPAAYCRPQKVAK